MELGIVGAGWRAEMWISLINKLQGVHITAVLCRNGARGEELHGRYGVPIVSDAASLCASGCSAVLVCVSKQNNCAVAREYLSRGLRVLCETPAGMNEGERAALLHYGGNKLQFAEQFPLQPRFAALKKCLEGGALGAVHTLWLSCCHGYHAAALARFLLDTGGEVPEVHVLRTQDDYAETQWRGAPREGVHAHDRLVSLLSFGRKRAFIDFSHAQYFSAVRADRVLVQGTHGELLNGSGMRLVQGEAAALSLQPLYGGQGCDLGAPDLISISLNGEILYRNPFCGLRLSEEEIGMASCLMRACEAFSGRAAGYPAAEAALDAAIAQNMSALSAR